MMIYLAIPEKNNKILIDVKFSKPMNIYVSVVILFRRLSNPDGFVR